MAQTSPYGDWEIIVGLEIHLQLNTKTKMFSSELNRYGDEPNTNIGYFDTGQPGSYPVVNREAVKKAIQFGLAVGSEVREISAFDRKSYFYPDCPNNYQITQFFEPLLIGGKVSCLVEDEEYTFTIEHTHLENDAGKLNHFTDFAGVDYNRSGAPLIEIVSDPCMRSAKEASAYAQYIRSVAQYLNISDCNMQEGMMRMDANISVRKKGETDLRPKVELKNMNSFYYMELAIDSEARRQIEFYELNPDQVLASGTYRYDVATNKTLLMRRKETADDYRYFPEPDLPPMHVSKEWIEQLRETLPELPQHRYQRYTEQLQLTPYNASVLIHDKVLCDAYEEALQSCKNPVSLCNWLTVEFIGRVKEASKSTLQEAGIEPKHIAQLVNLIEAKTITGKIAKAVADDMMERPHTAPEVIIEANPDYKPLDDTALLQSIVDKLLAAHPQSIEDYKAGKTKALQFLMGQVMKETRGKAPPEMVKQIIEEKIQK